MPLIRRLNEIGRDNIYRQLFSSGEFKASNVTSTASVDTSVSLCMSEPEAPFVGRLSNFALITASLRYGLREILKRALLRLEKYKSIKKLYVVPLEERIQHS